MAKPRIFVSSTFFDLRSVRANLERFIKEIGYEAVLFERGNIAYGRDEGLENYCYREINNCDIVVAIIGGKYGSQSKKNENSITQNEIKEAIDKNKQIYTFIEKNVHSEYFTYMKNKNLKGFSPASVDNTKIFDFIDSIYSLQVGNPVEAFETSEDIVRYLKEQWAGLFQRLLLSDSKTIEAQLINDLKSSANTLNSLVDMFTKKNGDDSKIKEILMLHHPAFEAIKKLAGIPYRVAFFNLDELKSLLSVRGYIYDEEFSPDDSYDFDNDKLKKCIRVSKDIFDEKEMLNAISIADWAANYIKVITIGSPKDGMEDDDPF
ncbi:DUF4062 domain-containing protein [Pectobacterium odoriferum]|uniref:DUF4062 domain-containing protein n=1 Tax=Pectobacterium odoriferum TaxID=78398 RepID=UPI000505B57D|nr:DUF4062 domain-containing protein [Pectobacterium odoriferum]KGA37151.1 hypothetical protein KS43_10085 [Pectobacterium odoriferum]